uniref:Uncharacterized protein n=1 Tax=Pseudonaja textilis TaxID=8673 RepID=A0A670Z416_PSETE
MGSLTPGGSLLGRAAPVFLLLLLLFLLAGNGGCLSASLTTALRGRTSRNGAKWAPYAGSRTPVFSVFSAADESTLDLLLEKAHRVLRVIEIKQSLTDLPKFWNWLHEVKIPSETREGRRIRTRLFRGGGVCLGGQSAPPLSLRETLSRLLCILSVVVIVIIIIIINDDNNNSSSSRYIRRSADMDSIG